MKDINLIDAANLNPTSETPADNVVNAGSNITPDSAVNTSDSTSFSTTPVSSTLTKPTNYPGVITPSDRNSSSSTIENPSGIDTNIAKDPSNSQLKKFDFFKKRTDINSKLSDDEPKTRISLPFDFIRVRSFVLNFIVPLSSLIISVLLIMLIILPYFKVKDSLALDLENKKTLRASLASKLTKLENLSDLKNVFDESLNIVNDVLPSEEKVPELLTQVDYIAKSSGMLVDRLSYSLSQNNPAASKYPLIDVSLSVKGNLDNFVLFLQSLEGASRLVNSQGYRYTFTPETSEITVTMFLQSPYLKVNSQAVTDDPINLDITGSIFTRFINKVKGLTYYDPDVLEPTYTSDSITESEEAN